MRSTCFGISVKLTSGVSMHLCCGNKCKSNQVWHNWLLGLGCNYIFPEDLVGLDNFFSLNKLSFIYVLFQNLKHVN